MDLYSAYETLGDEGKRKVYDQTGMNADEQSQAGGDPFGGFGGGFWGGRQGPRDQGFEEEIFGDFESFFNMGGMGQGKTRGQDVFMNLDLEFMEAINGANKTVKLFKKGVCTTCKGSKAKPGTAPSKCFQCGGRGTVSYRQGPMTVQVPCAKCRGSGATIKHPCPNCKGMGTQNQDQEIEVKIPKGINNGQSVRLSGKVLNLYITSTKLLFFF